MKKVALALVLIIVAGAAVWFFQPQTPKVLTYTHPDQLFSFQYPDTAELQINQDEIRLKPKPDPQYVGPAGSGDVLVTISVSDSSLEELQKRWGGNTRFTVTQFQGKRAYVADLSGIEYSSKVLLIDLGAKKIEVRGRSGMLDTGYFLNSFKVPAEQ